MNSLIEYKTYISIRINRLFHYCTPLRSLESFGHVIRMLGPETGDEDCKLNKDYLGDVQYREAPTQGAPTNVQYREAPTQGAPTNVQYREAPTQGAPTNVQYREAPTQGAPTNVQYNPHWTPCPSNKSIGNYKVARYVLVHQDPQPHPLT